MKTLTEEMLELRQAWLDLMDAIARRAGLYWLMGRGLRAASRVVAFRASREMRQRTLAWAGKFRTEAENMPADPPPESQIDTVLWKAMRDGYLAKAEEMRREALLYGHVGSVTYAGPPSVFPGRANYCRAARDGDCYWDMCPANSGEYLGKHCPLDKGCSRCLRAECEC